MAAIANLLWTGGWDSTYRLLELLLLEKRKVQPFYVIDNKRPSFNKELDTMSRIRDMIIKDWPETADRLMPAKVFGKDDIEPNAAITQLYNQIRKKERLGEQYEWLARMAAQLGINDLELSIETPLPHTFVGRHIRPFLARENPDDRTSYRLLHKPALPEVSLFSCFKWPVIEITKLDMQANAIKYGFLHVMQQTWFCHRPNRLQKPCGVCMPCHIAILEGMGHRVPLTSRIYNYYEFKIRRPLRDAFKVCAVAGA